MKLVTPRLALRLARRYAPTIIQEWGCVYDQLVPIHLGDFDPELLDRPTVYVAVKKDSEYLYCYYLLFHRKDWSELPWPLKPFDEHEYDFEGILRVLPRPDKKPNMKQLGLFPFREVSVFHHDLLFSRYSRVHGVGQNDFVVEAGGHGIIPDRPWKKDLFDISPYPLLTKIVYNLRYGATEFVNIGTKSKLSWLQHDIQPAFNDCGVHMPWQWNDSKIRQTFGKETDGLFWKNPRKLLLLAKGIGLLS